MYSRVSLSGKSRPDQYFLGIETLLGMLKIYHVPYSCGSTIYYFVETFFFVRYRLIKDIPDKELHWLTRLHCIFLSFFSSKYMCEDFF